MIFLPIAVDHERRRHLEHDLNVNPNIGLLNAIVGGLTGAKPVAWTTAANLQALEQPVP